MAVEFIFSGHKFNKKNIKQKFGPISTGYDTSSKFLFLHISEEKGWAFDGVAHQQYVLRDELFLVNISWELEKRQIERLSLFTVRLTLSPRLWQITYVFVPCKTFEFTWSIPRLFRFKKCPDT